MKVSLNTLSLFVVIVLFLNVANGQTKISDSEYKINDSLIFKYTDEGVFRQNNECNLIFVNFGTHNNLKDGGKINLSNKKNGKIDTSIKPFDVTINKLINGNIGLNNDTIFDPMDVKKYIQITQKIGDEVENITDFEIVKLTDSNTTFSLKINNINTCEGIVIKQLFKEETVVVANRLYYVNAIPEDINQSFDSKKFGPSLKYPFNRIHWKINEGLDDLRKTCGIYIYYRKFDGFHTGEKISAHWEYYLSNSKKNTINTKSCTPMEFFNVIKRNYVDYHYTEELLGEKYMGYVLKREGHVELHMDGVIVDNGYLVEMYQNSCNPEFEQQTSCTIRSEAELTFNEFVTRYATECLKINLEQEEPQWVINGQKAVGTFKHQIITIQQPTNDKKGKLPSKPTDNLIYDTFSSTSSETTPVARFTVSFECKDGTYMNNDCKCELCPINCLTCTSRDNCTECKDKEASVLEDGKCKNKPGYFEDKDGENTKCDDECVTCDLQGCLSCDAESHRILSGGHCVCDEGYTETADKKCKKCDDECLTCDLEGCLSCDAESHKVLSGGHCVCDSEAHRVLSDGQCVCDKGYTETADKKCKKCDDECLTCDLEGCLSCDAESHRILSGGHCVCDSEAHRVLSEDGQCVCDKGYVETADKKCKKCNDGCDTCNLDGTCLTCSDESKDPVNGVCVCKKSYYENEDGSCEQCSGECAQCNRKGSCTVCKDTNAIMSDGTCICKNSYLKSDGTCYICDAGCLKCNEDGCIACVDRTKEPVDGRC
ncbi:hypothetical protein BCR32DRAFT_269263 [Anaeromyces robustus]|uniref:TNFR-Cys domain-containing protein n=1 Tax=Anaeromyces robustus TaxID=1754192 RepID=A0A1Y1X1V8_9FUNG|nr:hypothetical protein BCR32DRAFT_269263 [Anaeromyces robustus]|eukprot:ORX79791.1 hypothetical protein BCR32DRAFT_269263 [Anaeromyces robustus]